MKDYDWILTERITGEFEDAPEVPGYSIRRGEYKVHGPAGQEAILTFDDDGRLLFDGEFIDVHDDFIPFLSTLDDIAELGYSEPYQEYDG